MDRVDSKDEILSGSVSYRGITYESDDKLMARVFNLPARRRPNVKSAYNEHMSSWRRLRESSHGHTTSEGRQKLSKWETHLAATSASPPMSPELVSLENYHILGSILLNRVCQMGIVHLSPYHRYPASLEISTIFLSLL
jgi:hypothetical protein